MKYRIGTRGSRLALAQAELVQSRLQECYPLDEFSLVIIKTKGDRILDRPLDQIGGKGIFVKEIEEQLLRGEIDLAVHSMKDMPAHPAHGLVFTKAWQREDARDVLVLREFSSLDELPEGAVIGTGSLRRRVQLHKLRPDITLVDIRGNVDTRLQKMREESLDGIVLAAAGLHRLGRQAEITQYMEPWEMIPAPAQGVLALEIREGDTALQEKLDHLADAESHTTAMVEREFLKKSGGDCHMSIGAYCEKVNDHTYLLRTLLGERTVEVQGTDPSALASLAMERYTTETGHSGKVYLLGAGPGDPGLLTVKGKQLLTQADCIVYDRLASPELLSYAPSCCEKIYVGKENHHHTRTQEEIQQLLIEKAAIHDTVVRLKGGDPYVFGRGGEEALALGAAGIAYEVVPGVTSAVAALSSAGIPVTHRGLSGGFRVMTAHDRRDALADLDFDELAHSRDTLIFLMGLSKLREITDGLSRAGMSEDKPIAVISRGTLPDQRVCQGVLGNIVEMTEKEALVSPAIIVVGEVVSLRGALVAPRKTCQGGKLCLVPKIGSGQSELATLLRQRGATVEEVQVGEIRYHSLSLKKEALERVHWLVFTSRHGVEGFFCSLMESGLDSRALANARIVAVGKKTANALAEHSLIADYVPAKSCVDELITELKRQVNSSDVVWYVRGGAASADLRAALDAFCRVEDVIVYTNDAVPFALSHEPEAYDRIFFTCGSSAKRLLQSMEKPLPERWQRESVLCSIGPSCTRTLRELGSFLIRESKKASYEELAQLM